MNEITKLYDESNKMLIIFKTNTWIPNRQKIYLNLSSNCKTTAPKTETDYH